MTDALLPLLQDILARLGNIESNLGIVGSSASQGSTVELPRSIRAYDAYSTEKLDPFVAACDKLGGDAATAGNLIKGAWAEMRFYLLRASACKEPSSAEIPALFEGVATKMRDIKALINRNEWERHTKTCAEFVQALNWLVVKPAPRDLVEAYIGGSDYWANGIRREFKATNPDHIAFCDTFKQLLLGLMEYIKEYHTTGVSWNGKGGNVAEYSASGAAASPAAPSTAAPSPAATTTAAPTPTVAPAATRSAAPAVDLFAALNKGGNITSGLKTVTKDMQTWRAEYKAEGSAPVASVVPKRNVSAADTPKGPAKLEFQAAGNKWVVENQSAANGVVTIEIRDIKESVYVFGCIGATINVTGKCKSIIVDTCKKTKVLFDNAMASCEVVNCQRMHVECRVAVGSVAVDKTDGIVIFLSESSLESKIVASKSSEMNLTWPDGNGNMIEKPIPEQYVHQITPNRDGITAEVSDLYGH